MTLFAGVDLGTGGARCLVVDERGARQGYGARAWAYEADDTGWPTLPPETALRAAREAMDEAMAGRAIEAIGVTSQRTGVVLLGEDGRELHVSPNSDGRAAMQGVGLERRHGEAVHRVAGRLPMLLYLPARLAWFRENRGETVAMALSLGDWLTYRLTGSAATENTHAAEMGVFDVAALSWSAELCRAMDVPMHALPPVLDVGTAAGKTDAGTDVVPAGTDSGCAALALGVTQTGEEFVVAGTTMICSRVVGAAGRDPTRATWLSPHHLAGLRVFEAHCGEAGSAVEWYARTLATSVDELASTAEAGIAGAGGVVFVDPYPSNVSDFTLLRMGGLLFPAPVLALGRPREDVARALFEGLAFGARAGLDVLDGIGGEPSSIAVAGGVARSRVFARALAGASKRRVTVATELASSALGAAIVAASSHHGGLHESVVAMRDRGRTVDPNDDDGYPAHYATWRERAQMLDERATRMSDLMR
ncbi:MAG: FGGY family carbohydrate kinase [Actinomycetota bacterium]